MPNEMTCYLSHLQTSEQPWVAEINLTMTDKAVLESPDGMLTDKHVDAASKLLAAQFPNLQGLRSSLQCQSIDGFPPIEFCGGFVPKGW